VFAGATSFFTAFLWCFFTFAGAVVEAGLDGFAAGAGVVPVWAAIRAVPATNNVVIRVFIDLILLGCQQPARTGRLRFTSKGVHLAAAFTPIDAHHIPRVHEKTFLNPFV
jgi:hypothetical protein